MPKLIAILLFLLLALPAAAAANETVKRYIPDAKEVGSGRLNVLFWSIYDATLYAPKGAWSHDPPYALMLEYFRTFKGADIAKRSVEEMRKIGLNDEIKLAAWQAEMRRIFPDVHDGTRLIGIRTASSATIFYADHNENNENKMIGAIQDPEFGVWFFNIWLSHNTSEPALRKKLLALQ